MTHVLSEYEEIRLQNIKRNEEFLKSIGMNAVTDGIKESCNSTTSTSTSTSFKKRAFCPIDYSIILPLPTRTTRSAKRACSSSTERSADTILGNVPQKIKNEKFLVPLPLPLLTSALSSDHYKNEENDENDENKMDENVIMMTDEYSINRERITADSLHNYINLVNPYHAAILKKKVSFLYFS